MRRLTAFLMVLPMVPAYGQRVSVPLDGTWQIEESLSAEDVPKTFGHEVPVPGLANLATPPFADVDRFDSRELIQNRVRRKMLPESALVTTVGVPRQNRNYFWYRRRFRVPARKQVAILKINKAQFGTSVWLNGMQVGEHQGCFTAGQFEVTEAMRWDGENVLVVRVGAHPAVLPITVPAGTDFEKMKWTPGIYDSVSLALADNPVIESVQIAPDIRSSQIVVQTVIRNYGEARQARLTQSVNTPGAVRQVPIGRNARVTVISKLPLPNARLWSPENPFLYHLATSTGGDSVSTRFGMREFRFDTATRRAYLNGKIYFLRGSNITLHRFFEDPNCGRLPWDEKWVRKLLVEIPKKMHWNSFRFCIGPVPQFWMDIADEAGLLIQNEFFVWTGRGQQEIWREQWDANELIAQFKEYMRDNWNHPSQAIWDAANETETTVLGEKVIPAVRSLDLSKRPWENGYNLPVGPDDPVEDHPYLFSSVQSGRQPGFQMTDLEKMTGAKSAGSAHPTGHAAMVNEYGWLWLNRDGTPTLLTDKIYEKFLGAGATPEQRFELNAYWLAGLTEFWRAHRNFAGVLHFVYLTASFPGVYTSDHFRDVAKLELEPHFADWMSEAFKPLGLYINFWQEELAAGARRDFAVMMANDYPHKVTGKLALAWVAEDGSETAHTEREFALPEAGQQTYLVALETPLREGRYVLKASALANEVKDSGPTVSRRKVKVVGPR